ncbi:hypothetical protein ACFL58_01520 [Elusimicrobiota bacterium]
MFDYKVLIVKPVLEMLEKIAAYLPTLLGALVILVIGWIVAKIIKAAVDKFLDLIKFEKVTQVSGITDALNKGHIKITPSNLISALVYWLVMIMVLVMTVNALGLTVASQLLEGLLGYLPMVIAAVFVLVLGLFLGNIVSGIVKVAAVNADLPEPHLIASISKWAIVVFAVAAALKQLGIAPVLVSSTFNIFFGAVCLALALAFGLGGTDAAKKFLEELTNKAKKKK